MPSKVVMSLSLVALRKSLHRYRRRMSFPEISREVNSSIRKMSCVLCDSMALMDEDLISAPMSCRYSHVVFKKLGRR